jgi:putative membrane protein
MAYHYLYLRAGNEMTHLILSWFIGALALWVVSRIIAGVEVSGFGAALLASAAIAVVDAVAGPVLRFFAFPFTVVTLGLFLLVVNATLLKIASLFTPGFRVHGFLSALLGSVVLTILNSIFRHMVFS